MRRLSPRDLKPFSRSRSLRQEVAEAESELRSASWKATTPYSTQWVFPPPPRTVLETESLLSELPGPCPPLRQLVIFIFVIKHLLCTRAWAGSWVSEQPGTRLLPSWRREIAGGWGGPCAQGCNGRRGAHEGIRMRTVFSRPCLLAALKQNRFPRHPQTWMRWELWQPADHLLTGEVPRAWSSSDFTAGRRR